MRDIDFDAADDAALLRACADDYRTRKCDIPRAPAYMASRMRFAQWTGTVARRLDALAARLERDDA